MSATWNLRGLLAGVAEVVPWLQQWHDEPDPVYGERMGQFFAAFVAGEAAALGVTTEDLRKRRPPTSTRGRRRACYLATSKVAALLEALQDFGEGLLPDTALRVRAAARVTGPRSAPAAARLTAATARGLGATAVLWAGENRACTQAWAANLHRAGWRSAYSGIAHDPAGRLRAVTLFDRAGAHRPYDDEAWHHDVEALDTYEAHAALQRYGVTVTRSDPDLPFVALDDTALLEGTEQ